MRLKRKAAATLGAAALIMSTSAAAGAQTTAAQVNDDESLKAFVEAAKVHLEAITDLSEISRFREEKLRTQGDWKSGPMFIIIFFKSGEPIFHGNDRAAENKNLLGVEDDRGTRVVEELLEAAAGAAGSSDTTTGSRRRHTLSNTSPGSPQHDSWWSAATRRTSPMSRAESRICRSPPSPHRRSWTARHSSPSSRSGQVVPQGHDVRRLQRSPRARECLPPRRRGLEIGLHLPVGREWWGRHPVSRIGAVSRRQAHGHDEDGLQRCGDRQGADRRRTPRGPEVPAVPLRQPRPSRETRRPVRRSSATR